MKPVVESYYPNNILKDMQEIVVEPIIKWRKHIDTIQIKDKKGVFRENNNNLKR